MLYSLDKLAKKLRKDRYDNGSVTLHKTKLAFKLNEVTGLPESCFQYPIKDSNRLVEEFMLLANRAVAETLAKTYPDSALLRRHEPPLKNKLVSAVRMAEKNKIPLRCNTSKELMESLDYVRGGCFF